MRMLEVGPILNDQLTIEIKSRMLGAVGGAGGGDGRDVADSRLRPSGTSTPPMMYTMLCGEWGVSEEDEVEGRERGEGDFIDNAERAAVSLSVAALPSPAPSRCWT